jgi:hypothetical protein
LLEPGLASSGSPSLGDSVGTGGYYGGVGILHAVGPVEATGIVHHGPGTLDLIGAATLRELVCGSPHVAARNVELV